jgi:hypothetical protein
MSAWQIALAALAGVAVAAPLAVLVGRSVRLADEREVPEPERPELRLVVNR